MCVNMETYGNFGRKQGPHPSFSLGDPCYCNQRDNEGLELPRFCNTHYQQLFDKVLTEFKMRAVSCNLQEKDRMMRADKSVFTMTGKLKELLLRVAGLTLEKAVKVCRAYEESTKQVRETTQNPPIHHQEWTKWLRNLIQESIAVRNLSWRKAMKVWKLTVTSMVTNMRKAEKYGLLGGRHVTIIIVKVEIILSPNARKYIQYTCMKILRCRRDLSHKKSHWWAIQSVTIISLTRVIKLNDKWARMEWDICTTLTFGWYSE